MNKIVYYICGSTSSGKTGFALALAKTIPNIVLINADIQQMFRGAAILAAAPTTAETQAAAHRLFQIAAPNEDITPDQWLKLACTEINEAFSLGNTPVLIGGSRRLVTLLASVAYGIQLESPHDIGDLRNTMFPYELRTIFLDPPLSRIRKEISKRLNRDFPSASTELVSTVHSGTAPTSPGLRLIGAQEILEMQAGDRTLLSALGATKAYTIRYAAKQQKMFRALAEQLTKTHPHSVTVIKPLEPDARVREAMQFILSAEYS